MSEPSTPEEFSAAITEIDKTPQYAWTPETSDRKLKLMAGQRDAETRAREQQANRTASLNAQANPPKAATSSFRAAPQDVDNAIGVMEDRIAAIQARLGGRSGYVFPDEQARLIEEQLGLEKDIIAKQGERGQLVEAIRAATIPPVHYPPGEWNTSLAERLHATAHAEEADGGLMAQVGIALVSGERYAPPAEDSDEYWAALHWAFGEKVPDVLDARDGILAMLPAKDRAELEKSGVLRYPSLLRYLSEQWQALHDPKNGERAYQRQLARVNGGAPSARDEGGRYIGRGRYAKPPEPGEVLFILPDAEA